MNEKRKLTTITEWIFIPLLQEEIICVYKCRTEMYKIDHVVK